MPDAAFRGVGGMVPSPYEIGRITLGDTGAPQLVPSGALASALANSSPEQQRLVSLSLVLSAFSMVILSASSDTGGQESGP
jgi:hypothetical protein